MRETAIILAVILLCAGCGSVPVDPQTTPKVTPADVGEAIARADAQLAQAEPLIAEMKPETVEHDQPRVATLVHEARVSLGDGKVKSTAVVKEWTRREKQNKNLVEENTRLKEHDEVKTALHRGAILMFALSVLAGIAAIFWPGPRVLLLEVCGGAFVAGMLFYVLPTILTAMKWIVVGSIFVALSVGAYFLVRYAQKGRLAKLLKTASRN